MSTFELKTYKTQKPKIRHGDTFATASPALFSRLIRFFTRSKVSHVGVFLIICDRVFVVEALEGRGVRMMLASKRFKKEKFVLLRGGEVRTKFVLDCVGDKYDLFGALVAMFWDTKSAQRFCSEAQKNFVNISERFSHLKRGVLPSDIVTALQVV